jgi:murein DD-endopeptidase MepM/ murein hydrolase activator NlpD
MAGAGPKILLIGPFLLSGCIPPAGNDVRIRGYEPPVQSEEGASAPAAHGPIVLVPEAEVIAPTVSWNPATVQRNAQSVDGSSYTVRSGETLYGVSNRTGASAEEIARANGLSPPYILQVGQRLEIPAGLFHRVSAGETGIAIARAYGVRWSELVSLNALSEPYILRAGQALRLPDSASAMLVGPDAPPDAQTMADAFTLDIDTIVTGGQPARAATEPSTRPAQAFATPIASPSAFAGAFGWPLAGNIVSRFGSKGGGQVNDGINIAAALGTPVGASGDGIVVYAGNEISLFGGLVMIDHGGGWISAYGHLGTLAVTRGSKVKRGHLLGTVGDTGYVTTPQLHFEIRKDRKPVDPTTKLPAR